jgi:hypothetical protein
MKINSGLEVLVVPEAVGHFLNRLNLGIEPFAPKSIGEGVFCVFPKKMAFGHLKD